MTHLLTWAERSLTLQELTLSTSYKSPDKKIGRNSRGFQRETQEAVGLNYKSAYVCDDFFTARVIY